MPRKDILSQHPNLRTDGLRIRSKQDESYNCVAYAAGEMHRWWWPSREPENYWPDDVPLEETVDAFVKAFETLGYVKCDDRALEDGWEKVAIYASGPTEASLRVKHMAIQHRTGVWLTKLGSLEDIRHLTLEGCEDNRYGTVAQVLKRPTNRGRMRK